MTELDRRLVQVVPSARQLALQRMEMYAFVHFTVNTFTDREWDYGTESPLGPVLPDGPVIAAKRLHPFPLAGVRDHEKKE